MDNISSIKKSIQKIASEKRGDSAVFTAMLKDVNGETCTIELDGLELSDVRLRAVVNGENSKILITPKKDSFVLCTDLSGGNLTDIAVVGFSEVEKIDIDVEDTIIINGGKNNGLIKIEQLHERLKSLESKFNQHTHPYLNVEAAATTSVTEGLSEEFQNGYSGYENDKIKH